MTSPAIADLAASFNRSLRAAEKAERTRVLYGQSIRFFCDWLTAQGRPTTLDQLNRHAITAWLADLADHVGVETVRTRLRGMRRFCRWLYAEGELDRPPTDGVAMPAPSDTSPRVLTIDELRALTAACKVPRGRAGAWDRRIFDGRRDEVLVRLLTDGGLRVSEALGLKLDGVELDREQVYVVGKGSRPRVVTVSATTGQAIDRYLRIRALHPKARTSDRLLLGERGPLSADGARWRLEQLGEAAGVKGLHPHALRHTKAHLWLIDGNGERDLMHQMGWRSEAMLRVYARTTAVERSHVAARRARIGDQF